MSRCPDCGERAVGANQRCPQHRVAVASAATTPEVLPPFPGYRTTGILGAGGFGTVYAARREGDGRSVAIKLAHADDEVAERLAREGDALATIGPPHVPALMERGRLDRAGPYLVMEVVTMPTLAEVMAAGRTGLTEFLGLASAILRAVEAVHSHGLAHRDLKPENIFVSGQHAKLIDFGLVKRVSSLAPGLTRSDALIGTAEYMAPEQCSVGAATDARTDVYALGVIFYEMLVGRPPFCGGSAEVQHAHRSQRPPRMRDAVAVSDALEAIVQRCLAKDPELRYPDAAALIAALATTQGAVESGLTAPAARMSPPSRRQRRTMGILIVPTGDAGAVAEIAGARGGIVAHVAVDRTACVFDVDAGASPARLAHDTGRELIGLEVCSVALVDVAPVSVEARGDGTRRYASARFERLALPAGAGLQLTDEALAALGDLSDARESSSAAPFIGRDEEVARLLDLADHSAAGAPAVAAVIAEPGHGKSRLHAVLTGQLLQRCAVLELRARDPLDGEADALLRDLIRSALALPASAPLEQGRLALGEQLGAETAAQLWPGVAVAMGWLDAAAPELVHLGAAPGALRAAAAHAVGEALRRRAATRPLAVLLDDAHWADETTLDALEYAALSEAGARLFVCAFGRPGFADSRPSWGERAAYHEQVTLPPLGRDAGEALCRQLLLPAEDPPARAIDLLLARSQGVPLLLIELTRALKRDGLLRQRERGGRWYVASERLDSVPDLPLVEWLTRRELDGLSPDLAAHARLVSLLGPDVTAAVVDGVVRQLPSERAARFPLDAEVGLRRLVESGVLRAESSGRYGFRHAMVRDAVTRGVPETLRAEVHHAAWTYYRDARQLPAAARLTQLAYHAARAGLREPARDAYFELAEGARRRHAYFDAEVLYSHCLEHVDGGEGIADRAFHGRGRVRYRLARYEDALADLARARTLAGDRADAATEVELLLEEATALDWMGDFASSQRQVEAAVAQAPAALGADLEAGLQLGLGRSLIRFSRDAEAYQRLRQAATTAAQLGDGGYETFVIANLLLGWMLPGLGKLEEAAEALERVVAESTARDDRLHLSAAFNNRAQVRGFQGDTDGMIADLRRASELAREVGQPTMELMAQFNLGELLMLMGEFERAAAHVERAVALEQRQVGDAGRPLAHILEARLRLGRGEITAARTIVTRIAEQQRQARARGSSDAIMVPAEEVLCAAIELATRAAADDEWLEVTERSTRFSIGQERIEVLAIKAGAERRAGRFEQARGDLRAALALCDAIPNVMRARLAAELGRSAPPD